MVSINRRMKTAKTKAKIPPLVPGLPILGNALGLMNNPVQYFVDAYQKYGPVFRVRIPTAPDGELTVLAGPKANVFASREGEKYFTTRQYFHHLTRETGTSNYLCALDGEPHAHFRKSLKPAFSRELLASYIPRMIDMVQERAQAWRAGERIGAMDFLQRVTIDQLSLAASNCPIQDDEYRELTAYSNTFVGAGVALRPGVLFQMPRYKIAKHRFETYLKRLLDWHRQNRPGEDRNPDLVDIVLAATYQDGQSLNEADQVAHAHLPYVNGLVYAGRVCGYLLYALLKHQALMEQLVEEVDVSFDHGKPGTAKLREMKLLRATLLESFRLYPIAGAAPRYVAHPFEFEGYQIEPGKTVFVAIVTPHFLPEIFPDPYKFDPYRFLEPRNEHQQPGAYTPYGLGRHVCISIELVETVAMTTIIGLLRTVRLELDPPNYTIKTAINPVPGPNSKFAFRVLKQRSSEIH